MKRAAVSSSVLGAELPGIRVGEPHQKQEIQARTRHTALSFSVWAACAFTVFCSVVDPDPGGQKRSRKIEKLINFFF
jgi:hypothetical protein